MAESACPNCGRSGHFYPHGRISGDVDADGRLKIEIPDRTKGHCLHCGYDAAPMPKSITPERFATLARHIETSVSARELAALKHFLTEQEEWTKPVQELVQERAIEMGWWPLPKFDPTRMMGEM